MRTLLAVDPGVHKCGVAVFSDEQLVGASWVPLIDVGLFAYSRVPEIREFIVEMPQVYPGMPKTDLNDLLNLATSVGYLEHQFRLCSRRARYYPAEWKAQVPKKVMTSRIMHHPALTELEIANIVRQGAKDHNTYDAVGLGLYHLGRMNRGGVK